VTVSVATGTAVEKIEVGAHTIRTDEPESDGTLEWDSTTIVIVQAHAGGKVGLGYTYTHDAAVRLIEDKLAPAVRGFDVAGGDLSHVWQELGQSLRNIGRPGLGFMALSAVCSSSRFATCSERCGTKRRSTAAAASPRTRSSASPISSRGGSQRESRA
jgi:hypothetical protein